MLRARIDVRPKSWRLQLRVAKLARAWLRGESTSTVRPLRSLGDFSYVAKLAKSLAAWREHVDVRSSEVLATSATIVRDVAVAKLAVAKLAVAKLAKSLAAWREHVDVRSSEVLATSATIVATSP